jgi:hypothetical protein
MHLGRDSWVWLLAIAMAILTYLASSEAPTLWHYDDWIKFAMMVCSTLAGKLSQSPLPKGGTS